MAGRLADPPASKDDRDMLDVVLVTVTDEHGDHNYAAIAAGAGRIVNAIPAIVAAEPGLHTALDLPLISGRGIPSSYTAGDGG